MTPVAHLELILGLLAVVLVLEVAARRLRLPPSAVLVLGGVGLALAPRVPDVELDPDLVLLLFLPPLLFAGGYLTAWRDFRANLRVIVQLAVGAVAFTTLVVGVTAHLVVPGLPWAACFALGAIVSPPDAVAAKAVLEGLPLPARLVTLLEGESLVNDATGLVLFRVAVAAGMTGGFSAWGSLGSFVSLSLGGVAVGYVYGRLVVVALARCREPHLSVAGGLLAAWGAYMAGDLLGVSGVLSAVAGGLVLGWRQHATLRAAVRIQADAVWGVLVFLLEATVFVLIGLSLRGVLHRAAAADVSLPPLLAPIAAVAGSMVLARFAWIALTAYVPRFLSPALRRRDPYPPVAVLLVLGWAGMRGVVSLAVALSLPRGYPGRDFLLTATLAIIVLSILLQGTTLAPLVRLLHLGGFRLDTRPTLGAAAARAVMARAAVDALRRRSRQAGGVEPYPRLLEQYAYRAEVTRRIAASSAQTTARRLERFAAILDANQASRAALLGLHRSARIHDTVLHALEAELDLEELSTRLSIAAGAE